MPRILHLVLFNRAEPYDAMRDLTLPWYNQFDELVDTFYYHFSEDVDKIVLDTENKLLTIPGKETFVPGILDKTLKALDYFFAKTNWYQYVVRSNASTVVNFESLLPMLHQQQHKPIFYGSTLVQVMERPPETGERTCTQNIDPKHFPLIFGNGTCIILHADAVDMLLENRDFIRMDIIDDLSLAIFFKELEQIQVQRVGLQFLTFTREVNLHRVTAFRNQNYAKDRSPDIKDMTLQVNALQTRFVHMIESRCYVKTVWYGQRDVTQSVVLLCKQTGAWQTNGSNWQLDAFFGDPSPGKIKHLTVVLDNKLSLTQNTEWTFVLDKYHENRLRAF